MTQLLNWGIIGTGAIARVFANALAACCTGRPIAVASRSRQTAEAFGREMGIGKRYPTYDELLADPDVQVVYISTPHPAHAEWAIRAADAGKHVLCEKPLTVNHAQAVQVIEAARKNDVFLMEAFMYRCHPQTARLLELVRDGAIGQVGLIQATFGFSASFDPATRIYSRELGGGAILDVGCYCVSMARLIAGAAVGKPFVEPTELKAVGHLNDWTGVDDYTSAVLSFPEGIIAQLSTGVALAQDNTVRIFGTRGSIAVPNPWTPGTHTSILLNTGGTQQAIHIKARQGLFAIEADAVGEAIAAGQTQCPTMSWEDTLGNMAALDRWRTQIGLTYPQDQAASP